jgi:hypothetical protein
MHTPLYKFYVAKLQHSVVIIRLFRSQKLNLYQGLLFLGVMLDVNGFTYDFIRNMENQK